MQAGPAECSTSFLRRRRAHPLLPCSAWRSNMLANKYAHGGMHSYCPPQFLDWQHCKQQLLQELVGFGADLLCLQEVRLLCLRALRWQVAGVGCAQSCPPQHCRHVILHCSPTRRSWRRPFLKKSSSR